MPGSIKKTGQNSKENVRPVEVYFNRLDASHKNPVNRLLHWIFVPLMVLGLLGMAWAIPFPYVKFIGKYNGYFNWASFLIAAAIYYYLKLSPLLSYFALFMLFGLSYVVMLMATLRHNADPELNVISVFCLLISLSGQYIGGLIEKNEASFSDDTKLLHITPLWVLYSLAKKLGLKY